MGFCIGRFSCRLGAVLGGIGTVSEASWAVLGLSSGPLGPFRSVVKLKGGESGGMSVSQLTAEYLVAGAWLVRVNAS